MSSSPVLSFLTVYRYSNGWVCVLGQELLRNKCVTPLCRLLTSKQQEAREPKQKRPYLATECHDVVEADKWRQQILREIGRKVMEIQNAGLGDHR